MPKHKISQKHLIILGLFLLTALGIKLWSYHMPVTTLVLRGQTLHVLVAKTPSQQMRGLGGRDTLGTYDGMAFSFPEAGRMGFVMRAMRFPLDIAWFSQGKLVDLAPEVPIEPDVPENQLKVYYPRKNADLVIEFPAGWAKIHGLVIGDALSLP